MGKILVEVFLPAAGRIYDVWVPTHIKAYHIAMLLSGALGEIEEGLFRSTDDAVLCRRDNGEIINLNLSAKELGLQNGSKLILI